MKVQSNQPTKITKKEPKLSQNEIQAKIRAKFGKKARPKQVNKTPVDSAEISGKKNGSVDNEKVLAGDIQGNDPKSQLTQDKLKNILKKGGFEFSEKERKTLAKILK